MKNKIVIATRKSQLALWQAEHVKAKLADAHPQLEIIINGMSTEGDKMLDAPLAKVGGKGLFVKALEDSILKGESDIAVHSMKDVPVEFPEGLMLSTIMEREDPRDAWVSNQFNSLKEIPAGSVVGTSSLRRQCLLKSQRPDLAVKNLRGNVITRLKKLDDNEYDAIILASAGLKRLKLDNRISEFLDTEKFIPAVGQGALGIECRTDDTELHELLSVLDHGPTRACVLAERAVNTRLNGGCQVPIAMFAQQYDDTLSLAAAVGKPDGSLLLSSKLSGPIDSPELLGTTVAEDLLAQGAKRILDEVYGH